MTRIFFANFTYNIYAHSGNAEVILCMALIKIMEIKKRDQESNPLGLTISITPII